MTSVLLDVLRLVLLASIQSVLVNILWVVGKKCVFCRWAERSVDANQISARSLLLRGGGVEMSPSHWAPLKPAWKEECSFSIGVWLEWDGCRYSTLCSSGLKVPEQPTLSFHHSEDPGGGPSRRGSCIVRADSPQSISRTWTWMWVMKAIKEYQVKVLTDLKYAFPRKIIRHDVQNHIYSLQVEGTSFMRFLTKRIDVKSSFDEMRTRVTPALTK